MGEACSTCGDRTGAVRVLVGRDEGNTPLGTLRRRWKNNTKIDVN